jgi:hypothetical protein
MLKNVRTEILHMATLQGWTAPCTDDMDFQSLWFGAHAASTGTVATAGESAFLRQN